MMVLGFTDSRILATGMLVASVATTNAFVAPVHRQHHGIATAPVTIVPQPIVAHASTCLLAAQSSDDEEKKENPYQDPNYPELEFVDYSDPEYTVDQGAGDEFFDTEAEVEAMREERRMRNDEFQFETYYKEILKEGQEFKGEWTVFRTSTFIDGETDEGGRPRLSRAVGPFKVISRGERVNIATESDKPSSNRLEYERILHHEKIFNDPEDDEEQTAEMVQQMEVSMQTTFWPDQMCAFDFRGQQGNMCVGNAYSICTGASLTDGQAPDEGPYASYRAELGITSDENVRFRIKLDYAVTEKDKESDHPPLHLKSFTICRETLEMWPRAKNYKSAIEAITEGALFGTRGAHGGLYDPPPVGTEEQASQYMMLDLEGRATVLLPYLMDQDPDAHDGMGWVKSLDWTPGKLRYQLDRKTRAGKGILGLRTLELSEVQSADADTYRPTDGGANMRQ
mmetsp:Transcript_18894/g.52767  ORF Transcript_18894/g.52767 Transcript_18894/m.52767 type:complete len:453 (-) Transcript_18894:263-1621(-)|eukprot:CAMPEP_0172372918 /NCGR_PEP_ID=MMETSP1060-20121228/49768_1 /TAXON_ID=37318 /ORGANISM="Pseudo-nitzschia pungens, Strain cf. cingulata" /LENGTH=452 /DNA_ID=CAMNT_0013099085 /DNA_START=59 /DNA_END=1417 /DNA_ORIENTATION=+